MAVIPKHHNPMGKQDTLDTWRRSGRMSVPSRSGHIIDLIVVRIYECTAVNGQPLDALIEARKTLNEPVKQFGVIWADSPPDRTAYDIPLLWLSESDSGVGDGCECLLFSGADVWALTV